MMFRYLISFPLPHSSKFSTHVGRSMCTKIGESLRVDEAMGTDRLSLSGIQNEKVIQTFSR